VIIPTRDGDVYAVARPRTTNGPYNTLPTSSFSNQTVTPEGAMALSSVYGAVTIIAHACGTMPLQVVDPKAVGAAQYVHDGGLARMLGVAPNRDMTSIDVWTFVFASLCLRGNAFLAKLRDRSGNVNELYPIPAANVTIWRAPNGAKLFRVRTLDGTRWIEQDFTEDAILHIKGLSIDDPLVGVSPITMLRHRMGVQLSQSEHQARVYRAGLALRGVLSTPQSTLNPTSVASMKDQWKEATGPDGDAIAVLHSGMQFQAVTMSLEDAQFVQTMKWGHTEAALAFQLPPSRLAGDSGDSSRYANMAQDDLFMFKQALMPRIEMAEGALLRDKDLFGIGSRWRPRFDPDKQLRADPRERWEIHKIRREIGAASTNVILADEEQPTIGAAGDDFTPLRGTKSPNQQSEDTNAQ
jgi:HK97 family phage portal protein